ncbi:PAS domain-containing protein [Chloroflexi bacterium CFX6]|nr:PAS domain-containing protein [Chloroflexi bacterium CFX6]
MKSSTELLLLDALLEEQSQHGGQYALPVKTIGNVRDYVKASDAILILFDRENPEWANRKTLGRDRTWKIETAFPIRDSVLCRSNADRITAIEYASESDPRFDPVIFADSTAPVRNVLLVPLISDNTKLGLLVFTNPEFETDAGDRYEFLKLFVRGTANAILTVERNRQLIVNNADLEASQWQILNSRNTLRTFFDNIPSSVFIIDRSYNIVAINKHRSERLGKQPQELVGEKCYEKLRGNSSPCADCLIMDSLNGMPTVRTMNEVGPNGTLTHWEITTAPIREDDDGIDRVIVFEEDVTEKWILEANLIHAEKMASIGQLAANVAHEINNPLAAIIANAQLLLRDLSDADEDIIDALKLIETAGDRAAKIVNNLLDSARREKHYEFEEISLNKTIEDAISLLRHEINKRSISIKLDLAREMPPILANKNQLKGVWINLVNNAMDAIASKRGRISISTRYENRDFVVVVSDNGRGMSPEHQEHVFEPFYTTKEPGKGTGLGLSVSLQAIKEHHGDIQFESAPGKGTKFVVILPDIDHNAY